MSFSSDVKQELCRTDMDRDCCCLAEAYGVLLYCNTFNNREIRIVTENKDFEQRLKPLFIKAFGVELELAGEKLKGKRSFLAVDADKLSIVYERLGYDHSKDIAHHVNFAVLEEECCKASFIRGAFLAGGSVTDPSKRYHFELVTGHFNVDRETYPVLTELNLEPKSITRSGNYITYFKQSEAIEDILTIMGAPVCSMRVMSAKVEKDMRNSINRKVNCDTANLEKVVSASIAQVDAIQKLMDSGGFEKLTDKLKQTAMLRLNNPEASISELAGISEPPVTKSCLNHRLRRITELAGM